jgi:hypothetical protein
VTLTGASLVVLLLLAAAPEAAQSQEAGEHVVRIAESVGYEIDAAERRRYGLFAEVEGFHQAEILQQGTDLRLRLVTVLDGERQVRHVAITQADLESWRALIRVVDRGRTVDPAHYRLDADPREGRLRMAVDVFLYGLWLYGPGTIALLDIDSPRGAGAVELLVGGGSFAAGLYATRDYRLGYAGTELVRWGSYAGTFYGAGLPVLLGIENDRVVAASAMALTPAGGWLAHRWSRHRDFGKGDADLVTNGAWAGALYGLALPYLAGVGLDSDEKLFLATSMAGVPAGAWVAAHWVEGRRMNRGRAHLITLGAFLGVAHGLSLVDLIDEDAPGRAWVGAAAAGAPAGVWAGARWTAGRHHSVGRARMITVGSYAGGLTAQGLVLLAGGEGRALTLAGISGSTLGLWLTDRLTGDWGDDGTGMRETGSLSPRLEGPALSSLVGLGVAARASATLPSLPLVRLRF